MKIKQTRIAILIASLTLVLPPSALAVALGEITFLSAINAPLRVEINAPNGISGDPGTCLRIVAPADPVPGLPAIRQGRINTTGHDGNMRVVISSPTPMVEPIAQLTIEDVCESRLRREYTLLFPYPEIEAPVVAAPVATPPAPRARAAVRPAAGARVWSTAPGESLTELARTLYPDDARMQQRFVGETARANPAIFPERGSYTDPLPAGTEIVIPDLTRAVRRTAVAAPRERAPAPARRAVADNLPLSPAPGDRLVVAPEEQSAAGTARSQAGEGSVRAGQMSDLDRRENEIAAAIDRSIVDQMELLARIKELEQIQVRLMEQASRLGVTLQADAVPAPPATVPAPAPVPAEEPDPVSDWLVAAGLLIGALAIAAVLIAKARRREPEPEPRSTSLAPAVTHAPAPVPETLTAASAPAPAAAAAPEQAAGVAPLEWDGTPTSFDPRALAPLAAEEEVEEHDSAIELADIMMSFGRVHGAAETLAEFIRGNPKQAVTPWLKLLEVYRAAGLRAEFDGLARQLNKTFNVKAVTWDNFDEARSAPDSLERMPHLIAALQNEWGTRECQGYLQRLLRDNREGTRQGFPLNVIDEILCLAAILEQQLGPYKAPQEAPPVDDAPETLPPVLSAGAG